MSRVNKEPKIRLVFQMGAIRFCLPASARDEPRFGFKLSGNQYKEGSETNCIVYAVGTI